MSFLRLIYSSRPFGFDNSILAGILLDARRCNERDDITGSLIARADLYVQLLEGPPKLVEAAFQRIAADDRHLELRVHVSRTTDTRLFEGWAMRDDPAKSWMWTRDDIAEGAIENASPEEAEAIFVRLRREALN